MGYKHKFYLGGTFLGERGGGVTYRGPPSIDVSSQVTGWVFEIFCWFMFHEIERLALAIGLIYENSLKYSQKFSKIEESDKVNNRKNLDLFALDMG